MLVLLLATIPAASRAATFTVHDIRSAREIGEATELYIDSRLVAAFHLDAATRQQTVTIQVAGAKDAAGREQHRYDLCGTITIRSDNGAPETHEVNATGLLNDPDRHRFEALGAEDFNLFYLSDPDDPAAADSLRRRSGLCHAPIS